LQKRRKFLSNFPEKKTTGPRALGNCEMTEYADVKTKYLSGGQQQRVALARVPALEPVFLLDEPLVILIISGKMHFVVICLLYLKSREVTVIVATHDSTDALLCRRNHCFTTRKKDKAGFAKICMRIR
jgi:ABC-type nitrate/sulfonate/bicarbonate transport system ATPase subunit